MDSLSNPQYRVISNHKIAEVRQKITSGQNALFALKSFNKGEQISPLSAGITSDTPTYLTMQIEIGKHITMVPEFLQYINHSCDPNTFFDTSKMEVIALKNIKAGEEFTFFYPSSEWEMVQPFHCYCGSSRCLGEIRGAAFISEKILKQYRLTEFIYQQLGKRAVHKNKNLKTPEPDIRLFKPYKIWVLAPQLESDDPNIQHYYDFTHSIIEFTKVFEELKADWKWQPVTNSNFKEVIRDIASSKNGKTPLVLNLCDGDEVNGAPGVSVIHELEKRGLIYTGSDDHFYRVTTSKIPMKKAFNEAGVPTANWRVISEKQGSIRGICKRVGTPLIIKPAVSGGSMGVSLKNVVNSEEELTRRAVEIYKGYRGWNLLGDGLFVEQFITGPEFTTFITGSADDPENCKVYEPVERVFHPSLPEAERFLSFDRLWEIYEDESAMPENADFYDYEAVKPELIPDLKKLSLDAYKACGGKGYTRIDIRQDSASGKLFVLEVNAQCGLSEDEDYTSIGAILKVSGISFTNIMVEIFKDALRRSMAPAVKTKSTSPAKSKKTARIK